MAFHGGDSDDKMWTANNEAVFIRIMHEHVKKGDLQISTFTKKVWGVIDDEVLAETGKRYTIPKLKAKFNRFRRKHREFSDLLNHTGFGWDPISNTVTAPDDVWNEYLKRVPSAKPYKKKGLEHYDILGEIFNTTTATGQMHFSSNQIPPSSDEERELEENFINSGVHVNNIEDIDESEHPSGGSKGKRVRQSGGQYYSSRGNKRWEKMENYMEICSSIMSQKFELQKSKSYESTCSAPEKYSTTECLQIIEEIGVDHDTYMKFVQKVVDIEWRKVFLGMTDERRRMWLSRL
ncbi:hypothetical protein LWI29_027326 [Acer saccharum]|uniref:Myb/SANT-like domain-containing protein n=1 Tax=Acer saccharum TaxID=4024 RepID=A0AA39T9X1_ACESA|nr:hypothetical protein LWI29_027326 [Acer saccharum]